MDSSIYIHWPFCIKKCHYCDLNSHVDHSHIGYDYVAKIIYDLNYYKNIYPNLVIKTVFFGGGTPSLMKPEWVYKILQTIKNNWKHDIAEITLEANPCNTIDQFKDVGINRISFGVQSFSDRILKFLGRDHTALEAINAIKRAKQIFDRVSIDLMYAIPGQTNDDLSSSLDIFNDLNLDHLSVYALTIEKNTVFGRMDLKAINDEHFCSMYELIAHKTSRLRQYEISNFCIPGEECMHNMVYWRYGNWIAVGPGSEGRMSIENKRYAITNERIPKKWLNSNIKIEEIAKPDVVKESIMMRLRIAEPILINKQIEDRVQNLLAINCVEVQNNKFHLTSNGFLKYNEIVRYLWS